MLFSQNILVYILFNPSLTSQFLYNTFCISYVCFHAVQGLIGPVFRLKASAISSCTQVLRWFSWLRINFLPRLASGNKPCTYFSIIISSGRIFYRICYRMPFNIVEYHIQTNRWTVVLIVQKNDNCSKRKNGSLQPFSLSSSYYS